MNYEDRIPEYSEAMKKAVLEIIKKHDKNYPNDKMGEVAIYYASPDDVETYMEFESEMIDEERGSLSRD